MYVCLCNALTEREVRLTLSEGARSPDEVFACCGVKERCGACRATMRRMVNEMQAPDECAEIRGQSPMAEAAE